LALATGTGGAVVELPNVDTGEAAVALREELDNATVEDQDHLTLEQVVERELAHRGEGTRGLSVLTAVDPSGTG